MPDGATVVVVSHGGVIRVVEAHLGGEPHPVPNLGGIWLHAHPAGLTLGARIALLDEQPLTLDGTEAAGCD